MEKRIEKLKVGLARFDLFLEDKVLNQQIEFLDELIRWSQRVNLTAILNWDEGIEKHLIDSLVLLPYLQGRSLLDIGTGAGLPSIPLALARPELKIVSIESVGKKINFQNHIRRKFSLKNLTPLNCRVENFEPEKGFPIITARAFASIEKILQLVRSLLEDKGELLLLRGARDEVPLAKTEVAMREYGFLISEQITYKLPFSHSSRQIIKIIRK